LLDAFEFDAPGFVPGLLCQAAGGEKLHRKSTNHEMFVLNLTAL
jgi:hypothetical protein